MKKWKLFQSNGNFTTLLSKPNSCMMAAGHDGKDGEQQHVQSVDLPLRPAWVWNFRQQAQQRRECSHGGCWVSDWVTPQESDILRFGGVAFQYHPLHFNRLVLQCDMGSAYPPALNSRGQAGLPGSSCLLLTYHPPAKVAAERSCRRAAPRHGRPKDEAELVRGSGGGGFLLSSARCPLGSEAERSHLGERVSLVAPGNTAPKVFTLLGEEGQLRLGEIEASHRGG